MTTPVEDEDSSSGCSMEGSNTDSGRGPSEDGEQTHNDHGKLASNLLWFKFNFLKRNYISPRKTLLFRARIV